jgi:hypothetical protein
MKKRITIIAISLTSFIVNASAQETRNADHVKKQYKCFVSIKTTNGKKIEAALSGLTADSIILAPVETKYVKAGGKYIKVLRQETDTMIAANHVRTFKIKYDPNIIYTDEVAQRRKQLKKDNAGKIFEITIATLATVALIPVTVATGGAFDPTLPLQAVSTNNGPQAVSISGNRLSITENYKFYQINGKSDRYIKMVKRLTKSKTNPFEYSIARK